MDDPTPKLHIDEDWKQQAQAEKEALAREAAKSAAASAASAAPQASLHPAPPPGESESSSPKADHPPLPAASLPLLLSMFASEAMVALGQIPSPTTGQAELDLDAARHYIDMLAVIEEKTEGNRTPDEAAMLSRLLHDLRMAFVAIRGH